MNKNNEIEKELDTYIENLYQAYGSETGVLFGIPSNLRDSVRAIVKLTLQSKQKDVLKIINKFFSEYIIHNPNNVEIGSIIREELKKRIEQK